MPHTNEHLIRYHYGDPVHAGCYAVRIDEGGMLQDKFLQWHDGIWFYPLSERVFLQDVIAWIGPLARTLGPVQPDPNHPRDAHGKFTPKDDHQ